MILPASGANLTADANERQPSRTYKLDLQNGRVTGYTDGIEAVKQYVLKQLMTDRFTHQIYSGNIGHEIRVGGSFSSNLEASIKDALLIDDRIDDVQDFQSNATGDKIEVSFNVVTIYGRAEIREVI